jgi:hypothetical protein
MVAGPRRQRVIAQGVPMVSRTRSTPARFLHESDPADGKVKRRTAATSRAGRSSGSKRCAPCCAATSRPSRERAASSNAADAGAQWCTALASSAESYWYRHPATSTRNGVRGLCALPRTRSLAAGRRTRREVPPPRHIPDRHADSGRVRREVASQCRFRSLHRQRSYVALRSRRLSRSPLPRRWRDARRRRDTPILA